MSKFHINPKTGNTGICKAKAKCPFGNEDEHFGSREEAQAHYEKKQAIFEHFNWKSKMPPAKGAYTLATYDPMSENIPVEKMWGNEYADAFFQKMEDSEDETRLVLESGQVWEKQSLYGEHSWKFVSGDIDYLTRLERGKTYDVGYLMRIIQQYGARIEKGGARPTMPVEHRKGIIPESDEARFEAKQIGKTYGNPKSKVASEEDLNKTLDDYVANRWSDLTSGHHYNIKTHLKDYLGQPRNAGTDEDPAWVWSYAYEEGTY